VINSCPTDAELLQYRRSSATSAPATDPIGRHLMECARCQGELAELRRAASLLRSAETLAAPGESVCLDDLTIAALAEGALDSTARQPAIDHLLTCGHCRQRVAEVARMLRDATVAAEVRAVEVAPERSRPSRRWLGVAGGVAAAAVLVLLVRTVAVPRVPEPVHREEPVTLISAPVLLQPTGAVAGVDSLSWRSVPRATQYHLTLFAQEGTTVWDTETSDTAVALPATVHLVAGATYYWKVEARTDWNRWTASDMIEIRIRGR
jgi:hypothetical protein